jgi:hypothetical protein
MDRVLFDAIAISVVTAKSGPDSVAKGVEE